MGKEPVLAGSGCGGCDNAWGWWVPPGACSNAAWTCASSCAATAIWATSKGSKSSRPTATCATPHPYGRPWPAAASSTTSPRTTPCGRPTHRSFTTSTSPAHATSWRQRVTAASNGSSTPAPSERSACRRAVGPAPKQRQCRWSRWWATTSARSSWPSRRCRSWPKRGCRSSSSIPARPSGPAISNPRLQDR